VLFPPPEKRVEDRDDRDACGLRGRRRFGRSRHQRVVAVERRGLVRAEVMLLAADLDFPDPRDERK
jgi:hypothetical protein